MSTQTPKIHTTSKLRATIWPVGAAHVPALASHNGKEYRVEMLRRISALTQGLHDNQDILNDGQRRTLANHLAIISDAAHHPGPSYLRGHGKYGKYVLHLVFCDK